MHIRWRGLELPSAVTCEAATLTSTYGKFIAEPFERGFGSTIGNGLRRVLLSSLEGSAVTQIKVHNAQHEFTTIKGVLRRRHRYRAQREVARREEPQRDDSRAARRAEHRRPDSRFAISKPMRRSKCSTRTMCSPRSPTTCRSSWKWWSRTAAAMFPPPNTARTSKKSASSRSTRSTARSSAFATASKKPASVRRRTTTSSRSKSGPTVRSRPKWRSSKSAKILRKHLNPFVQYTELGPQVRSPARDMPLNIDAGLEAKLAMTLADLNLSVRAGNCLESENIMTVRDLVIAHRRSVAGSSQLRRNHADRSSQQAPRFGPPSGHAASASPRRRITIITTCGR